jgi:hypothetical protein
MSSVKDLHAKAMDLAEAAFNAKMQGALEKARTLSVEAFQLEKEAAKLLAHEIVAEPTRSILHRSAASLALDCGEVIEAEKILATALSGNPPNDIAEELRDLLEQVYFTRHLELRGIILEPTEVQLAIAGSAVGFGMAQSNYFLERVKFTEKLLYRTVERKNNKPFRDKGKLSKDVQESFELYLSVPRAASFAISLRIGLPKDQLFLPGMDYSIEIIDEVLSCIELFNNANEEGLREKIKEESYYQNFVALAKQLAPDGDHVNFVGFTTIRDGKKREVSITRKQDDIRLLPPEIAGEAEKQKYVKVKGQLLYADSTKGKERTIKLIDEGNIKHTIIVPEGMMSDIVKPLWEETVVIDGLMIGKRIQLIDIKKSND